MAIYRCTTATLLARSSSTPQEALIKYCGGATNEDPRWAYFWERVFRNRENKNFPADLGDRKKWVQGVGDE